ncbi:TAXI family TRAP transporter solute-binding subunit [Leucobacter sp. CSA2]|uniref:TAXI family TRAP transporter solute-binding subunit n=1 Tax=Leucobacter edaphi TaxID=2796472 RepID=A0A934UX68_9MICO|nr:TAXI family TRAP transporter solute-binding subunit [Leucobacter edaphi]
MRRNGRVSGVARAARLLVAALCSLLLLTSCSGPLAGDAGEYTIAGGGTHGIYYAYASEISTQLREGGLDITVTSTAGSLDNLRRVADGRALLGFAQADAAADAVAGTGAFSKPEPIRAVARVYDEYVHVLVPESSSITGLGDLRGKRVSIGDENSGVRVVATRALAAAGLSEGDFTPVSLGLDDSVTAMQNGEIDAIFWVGGIPTPGIERLAVTTPLRLLPIPADVVETMNSEHNGVYRMSDVPEGSYGTHSSIQTMTIPNYLIVSAGAPDALVSEVVATIFAARPAMSKRVPVAALLDRRQAIFTAPVPLHPGAEDYYTSHRL